MNYEFAYRAQGHYDCEYMDSKATHVASMAMKANAVNGPPINILDEHLQPLTSAIRNCPVWRKFDVLHHFVTEWLIAVSLKPALTYDVDEA